MTTHNSVINGSGVANHCTTGPLEEERGKIIVTTEKTKNIVLAVGMVVLAILLIVGALGAVFILPHLGFTITPMFSLLIIPVLVGLVKIACSIFILHRPVKSAIGLEESVVKNVVKTIIDSKDENEKQIENDIVGSVQQSLKTIV